MLGALFFIKSRGKRMKRKVIRKIEWECPTCLYRILDVQMKFLRFNVGCPRCETLFTEFICKTMREEDET
jgi:hypothetical protein